MLDLLREAHELDGRAAALEQWLKPWLDTLKGMREMATRFRRAGRGGPVEEPKPPSTT